MDHILAFHDEYNTPVHVPIIDRLQTSDHVLIDREIYILLSNPSQIRKPYQNAILL